VITENQSYSLYIHYFSFFDLFFFGSRPQVIEQELLQSKNVRESTASQLP